MDKCADKCTDMRSTSLQRLWINKAARRSYYGGLTQEQLNKIPLNLSESILKSFNTFDITTPDSSQWRDCRDELLDIEKGYVYEAHNIFGWPFKRKVAV